MMESLKLAKDKLSGLQLELGRLYAAPDTCETVDDVADTIRDVEIAANILADELDDLFDECTDADKVIEELRATLEECEADIESLKPQTLLDEQKAEILKKLEVLDLETLQHLESILGLQFAPPYS